LGFWLAHHQAHQLSRCYQVWWGERPVWLCARCAGLYPALLLGLGAQLVGRWPAADWEALWLGAASLPALWDWAEARLGGSPGNNPRRTWTGALLGLALGRSAGLHGLSPFHPLAWGHLGMLCMVVVGVELVARLAGEGPGGRA
jgi:hypothetical protein